MRDYQTKQNEGGLPDSINTEFLGAGEANSTLTESKTAVSSSGQTLAPADGTGEVTDQLAKALAIYGGGGAEFCIDTGATNAYVLSPVSPKKAIPAYFDGMTLSFVPGNVNTGNATVNYSGLGLKDIRRFGNISLNPDDISCCVTIRYSASGGRFEIVSTLPYNLVVFTSSGTYNKPANLKYVELAVTGGGGGAGGVSGDGINPVTSVAGAAGSTAIKKIIASNLSASETVTIGSGGAGGAAGANNGIGGGTSSFGAHATAGGGSGGSGQASSSTSVVNGATGGGASGGDINISGGSTGTAASGPFISTAAPGGASIYGGGGSGVERATGGSGSAPGSGGGATSTIIASSHAGGVGADGIIIVKEYF